MDNIFKDMIDTIKKSDLASLVSEVAETNIDKILDDGIVKDIPILRSAAAIYNISKTAKNKLLFRSINKFIEKLAEIPDKERVEMFIKIENDKIDELTIAEFVLLSLERADLPSKGACIAALFKSYLKEEIKIDEFSKYCFIVENMSIVDLKYISQNYKTVGLHRSHSSATAAMGNGLIKIQIGPYISASNDLKYEPTADGLKFGAIISKALA